MPKPLRLCLRHGQAKVLLTDREFATVVGQSLALLAHEELCDRRA